MLNPHIGYNEDGDDDIDDEVWTTPTTTTPSSTTTKTTTATSSSSSSSSTTSMANILKQQHGLMMMSTDSVDDTPQSPLSSTSSTPSRQQYYNNHQSNNGLKSSDGFENSTSSDESDDNVNSSNGGVKQPRKWLSQGETILFSKESIMYKMNIGIIYVTSKRVVWTTLNGSDTQDVFIEILQVYQTSMSTSSNQSCWKISSSGGDYLFFFQSKDDIREINTFYQKSKAQLYEQNPSLRKSNPHQHRQQQLSQQPPPQPPPQQPDNLYPNISELNVNNNNNNNTNNNSKNVRKDKNQNVNHHQQQHQPQQSIPIQQVHHHQPQPQQQYKSPPQHSSNGNHQNNHNNNHNNNNNGNVKNGKKQVDDDFVSINEGFSVGDTGDSSWEEESNGLEQFGYFDIEVKDPRRAEEDGQTFVTYEICGKLKEEKGVLNVKTRRRYKEFEWLHQQLSLPSDLHARVPTLPQKSMIQFWNKTDQTAVVKRCFQLDSFMKEISKSVSLRNHPATKVFMSSKPISIHQTTFSDFIGNTLATSTLPGLNDIPLIDQNFIYNSVIERDYWFIRRLMKKWDLLPKKLPFQKFLVVVLGTTSAGKSSFINNFFNIQVKRSAIGQLDTHFTLVETIPKEQFAQLSDKLLNSRNEKPRRFTNEQLNEKITTEPMSDPRYGHVFLYMDTTYTLSRYDAQFSSYADIISKYGLVRSILINDDYLTGTDEEKEYQRRTIFLDSPGFESKKESNPESLLGNIKIIQFFYSTSDLTLFMMPAKNISLVSPQIQILEISVMYKLYGPEIVDQMVTKIVKQRSESKSFISFPEIAKFIVNQFSRENRRPNQEYVGTLVWDKIRFLLTQIDDIQSDEDSQLREQYFELGRLLGKSLTFLDPPTYTQCMAIALPLDRQFKSTEEKRQKCGDLDTLLYYIRSLNSDSSYHSRLEAAIQEMSIALLPHIQNSWKNYLDLNQWISSDYACVDQIRERSSARLRSSNSHSKT